MSRAKIAHSESSEDVNIHPILSPESQKDLENELSDLEKSTWVEETRRDLFTAFACGRRVAAASPKNVDVFSAKENTDKDLREILRIIYEKYGKLAMYDKGLDGLARHWVVGYQSIKGRGTVQKVTLYVEGTEWIKTCPVLGNLAAMIDAEDVEFPDAEGWAVVEKPIGGVGFKHYRA